MVTGAEVHGENQLLAALSASDYSLLRPHLRDVRIELGSELQDYGQRTQHVYFPLSGMISMREWRRWTGEESFIGLGPIPPENQRRDADPI